MILSKYLETNSKESVKGKTVTITHIYTGERTTATISRIEEYGNIVHVKDNKYGNNYSYTVRTMDVEIET